MAVVVFVADVRYSGVASNERIVGRSLVANIAKTLSLVVGGSAMSVRAAFGVETHIGTFAGLGRVQLADAVRGTIAINFALVRVDAHVERITDETRTAGTGSSMVGRCADRIFATQKLFARILTNVDIVGSMHANCIRWAGVIVETFMWKLAASDQRIIRTAGVAFGTCARHKVLVGKADCIQSTKVGGATIDASFDAMLIQLTDFLRLAVSVRCALVLWHAATE